MKDKQHKEIEMKPTVRYGMSRKDIVKMYRDMIADRSISHNGAGFRRMMQLSGKLKWNLLETQTLERYET